MFCLQAIVLTFYARHGWWNGSSSRYLQLHNAQVHFRFSAFLTFSHIATSIGSIIGTGIFSTPSSILGSVRSVGASLMLWVLGFVLSLCGLCIWLEFGTMFPRSGGEKVYLEAVYRRPRHLATVIFAANAIILNFSSSNCIVSSFS
jgi:amino acid transporter